MSGDGLTDSELLARCEACLKHGGNRSAAARELGIKPDTMRNLFNRWTEDDFKAKIAEIRGRMKKVEESPADVTAVERLISGKGATLEELTAYTKAKAGEVLDELDRLHAEGLAVVRHGDMFRIDKAPPVGNVGGFTEFVTGRDNRIKFGISCDKHYGSKYCRKDVIRELYQWFADEGVQHVLDGGNYIEGESRFNRHDLEVHGLDGQVNHLVEELPEHPGMTTYAVSGDDHEGWYAQREGIDIGRYVEATFRNAGREDWINLGYMEAYFDIVNASSGAVSKGLVMHPGGGSSYAISYALQKIIEVLEGGEKPAFLCAGHYHKLLSTTMRNVWAVLGGCAQDQTPFMRKKRIDAHIGGFVIEFEQDPETGALIMCKPEIRRWFNQGYYNHRWTPHGRPTLPSRQANRA